MGKKNKKSRQYDDDDILGGPSTANEYQNQIEDPDHAGGDSNDTAGSKNKPAPKAVAQSPELIHNIKSCMKELLRSYPDKPDDWLYRTIEKNLRLKKKSLAKLVAAASPSSSSSEEEEEGVRILQEMRNNVELLLDEEECQHAALSALAGAVEREEKAEQDDGRDGEDQRLMSNEEEVRIRAEARMAGMDPEEAVMMAKQVKTDLLVGKRGESGDSGDSGDSMPSLANADGKHETVHVDDSNVSFLVSVLLALKPYSHTADAGIELAGISALLRPFCILLYHVLALLFGKASRSQADNIWMRIQLPKLQAAQHEEDRKLDDAMLRGNDHLWCVEEDKWIKKDNSYHPPTTNDNADENEEDRNVLLATIRYNSARQQWERWSKNLTTRTKASKAAEEANSISNSKNGANVKVLTKGSFVPVKPGEGWATAPNKAEVVNSKLTDGDVSFLACLPVEPTVNEDILVKSSGNNGNKSKKNNSHMKNTHYEIVDVTTWASRALLPKGAARALEVVDSGKALFQFDLPQGVRKSSKGGRKSHGKRNVSKGHKRHEDREKEEEDDDDDVDWLARKGIGLTARVCDRYLDKMELDLNGDADDGSGAGGGDKKKRKKNRH